MKSVKKNVESTKSDYKFPCLVKYPSDGVVILATGYIADKKSFTGTCVHVGSNSSLAVGEMRVGKNVYGRSCGWTEFGTELYNSVIELSN